MHVLLALASVLSCTQDSDRAPELSDQTLKKWLDRILPTSQEDAWRAVGWRTEFGAAVQEAAGADRPVLLWLMNGHPCGAV